MDVTFKDHDDRYLLVMFNTAKAIDAANVRFPKVLDIIEINNIFKSVYLNGSPLGIRNIVVIELLFATGARVSEIANIKIEDIDIKTGNIIIKGKGNKERIIQICNPETLKILNDYFIQFNQQIIESGGFLLINRLGNRLSDQSIRGIVKKISIDAKVNKHITPHVFRHTLATLLLEKDVDIKYIQSILGHSSIMTTQIYTHVNGKKQREILDLKHPRKDFTMSF